MFNPVYHLQCNPNNCSPIEPIQLDYWIHLPWHVARIQWWVLLAVTNGVSLPFYGLDRAHHFFLGICSPSPRIFFPDHPFTMKPASKQASKQAGRQASQPASQASQASQPSQPSQPTSKQACKHASMQAWGKQASKQASHAGKPEQPTTLHAGKQARKAASKQLRKQARK